ncbi:MAG: hypothetical protein IJS26_05475 [Alphaproteobacteria bacterium]|nr:hypothetical protein [Alphaproteobacteria bacterium]
MIGNIAQSLSNIGLGAVQKANVVGGDTSNWAQDLTTTFKGWKDAKTRQAYIDQLTNEHPEDAAKINADPVAYAKMLEDRANAERDQQYKMDILGKQFENALALEGVKNQNAVSLAKLAAELKGNQTTGMQNIEYLKSLGYSPEEAAALYYGGQNPNLNVGMLGKKGQEEYDKKIGENLADEAISKKQMQTLQPKVENALARARESFIDGTGLGQFGGLGWTTEQGGINRANVKNAQAQINTTMRGLLKQMGVGSTELNSAAEAEAYRYMIDPKMPIAQQAQVLKNFEQDYLSGNLQRDLAETYGNKTSQTTKKNWSAVSNEDLLKGL